MPYLIVFVFAVVSGICLFYINDDYIWFSVNKYEKLEPYRVPNGRYFSNMITLFFEENPFLRPFIYICTIFLMIVLLSGIINNFSEKMGMCTCFGLTFLILVPSTTYSEVINWFSGFTNYAFALIFTLVFLRFSNKLMFSDYQPKKISSLFFLITGVAGGLCVEHLTVYNIMFSIFVLIFMYVGKKKINLHTVAFLVGNLIGAFMMFSSSIYSSIYESGDDLGVRGITFSMPDIYMKIFRTITLYYVKEFWAVTVLTAVLMLFLYFKSDKKYKYAKICTLICIIFSVYSVFTSCFSDFYPTSAAMKIRAVEFSFNFLYIISLIYLIYAFTDGKNRTRLYIYLFSTLAVTAPFIFVSPVTARCFFVDYMFWILFAGELFMYTLNKYAKKFTDMIFMFFKASAVVLTVIICGIDITNKYYDSVRFDYINEQVADNAKNIQIIQLPYPEYAIDDFEDSKIFNPLLYNDVSYAEFIFVFHNIDADAENMNYSFISAQDYTLSLES